MDMMSTMMELDKLPDPFTHPFQDFSELHFSGDNPTTNHRAPPPPPPPPPLQPIYPTTEPPQFPLISHDHYPRASWLHHKPDSMEAMREMIFRMAALQPVQIDPESVKPPKRRNVRISKDPQSVAARHRRERISERIRILQRLVPGGTKMDTASMLDEAVHYMKFLKKQVESLEQAAAAGGGGPRAAAVSNNVGGLCPTAGGTMVNHHNYVFRACGDSAGHMVGSMELLK